jgi:hypothetical protein
VGVEDQDSASPDESATVTLDDASIVEAHAETVDAPADPSPAAKDEKTLLSVVRDAVQPTKDAADPSPASASDHQAAKSAEPDNEAFADVPFHNHPRFRELIQQRNDLRAPAESYRKIEAFLVENAIEPKEASDALNWTALMKRDPEQAWAQIKPVIQDLLLTIGEVLPPDLRAQVQSGQLPADVAKALAKERAKATIAQGQLSYRDKQTEAQRKRQETDAASEKHAAVVAAARAWDTAKRTGPNKDPDFAKKERRLKSEVLLLQREDGIPDTPEGVKAQLDKALRAVNAEFAAAVPRRPGITPVTGGSVSGSPRAQPKSILEVVQSVGAR